MKREKIKDENKIMEKQSLFESFISNSFVEMRERGIREECPKN